MIKYNNYEKRSKDAMKQKRTEETGLYYMGLSAAGLGVLVCLILRFLPIPWDRFLLPCIFLKLTGYYCPGCGGTRAVTALLQGRLWDSFVYHPLVIYTAAAGGWFFVSQTIERLSRGKIAVGMKYRDLYLWIALVLVGINFAVKNMALFFGMDLLASA